ncbi:hypothetical protein FRB96_003564 [Tulasnella sp. 330]|nr:hypothetical protein FRB96_003564 [Tulasnella sp. 330]
MAPANSTIDNAGEAQQSLGSPASCPNGVYISPSLNTVVDPSKNLTVQWDSTCFADETSMQLDLYRDLSLIHEWDVSNSSTGQLTVNLDPTWWVNATSATTNTTFYFSITPNTLEDAPSPAQLFPQGPIFTIANYTSTTLPSGGIQGALSDLKSLSQPQLIAAITAPILTVIVLGSVIFAVMRSRAETARQRREWMEGIRPVSRY